MSSKRCGYHWRAARGTLVGKIRGGGSPERIQATAFRHDRTARGQAGIQVRHKRRFGTAQGRKEDVTRHETPGGVDPIPQGNPATNVLPLARPSRLAHGHPFHNHRLVQLCQTAQELKHERANRGTGVKRLGGTTQRHTCRTEHGMGLQQRREGATQAIHPVDQHHAKPALLGIRDQARARGTLPQGDGSRDAVIEMHPPATGSVYKVAKARRNSCCAAMVPGARLVPQTRCDNRGRQEARDS